MVYIGKGGRTRTIPLSAPASEALADLEAVGAIGPFSTSTVRRAFIRAAARSRIHGVRLYDLRHSYGTALYRVAGDTRLVREVLGHSDTRMTERYTLGQVPEAMRLATSRFEEHLEVPDTPSAAVKRAATRGSDPPSLPTARRRTRHRFRPAQPVSRVPASPIELIGEVPCQATPTNRGANTS